MNRCRILFLAAEPRDQARHAPDPEFRAISQVIQASRCRDQIDLQNCPGVTFKGLQSALMRHRPHVLHISSHGSPDGIYLVDERNDESELLAHQELTELLQILNDNLQLVIVSACSSTSYIDTITRSAPAAIGMPPDLPAEAAVAFSSAFYLGISDGRTVEASFQLGELAMRQLGLAADRCPQLHRQRTISEPAAEAALAVIETGDEPPDQGFVEAVGEVPGVGQPSPLSEPRLTETVLATVAPMRLILLPGGDFMMGSPENEPHRKSDETPHDVRVSRFQLAEKPVTQAQWRFVMGHNPSLGKKGLGGDRPVQNVSWYDAVAFLNQLSQHRGLQPAYTIHGPNVTWHIEHDGYRLPTEAEWEYACRASTDSAYSFGDDPSELKRFAWFGEGHDFEVHPVGSKGPNPWGLYDMHGNVWEWVWDWYDAYAISRASEDPQGPRYGEERVLRGGSSRAQSKNLRSAKRFKWGRQTAMGEFGLRVARSGS